MKPLHKRVAIFVPGHLNRWFAQPIPVLTFKPLSIVRELPNQELQQEEIWNDFLNDWETTGALFRFDPRPLVDLSLDKFKLEQMIRAKTATPEDFWVLNCLPDTWISISETAAGELVRGKAERRNILDGLDRHMRKIHNREDEAKKNLKSWIESESLQVLRISAAQSSPRFLGERIRDPGTATDLLTHSVMAVARSEQRIEKGDFAKGWIWP